MAFHGAKDSRPNHKHQAVAKAAYPHHEVGQRQPELQQTNGPLVVVISVEKDGVFTVALKEKDGLSIWFCNLLPCYH